MNKPKHFHFSTVCSSKEQLNKSTVHNKINNRYQFINQAEK